jgi:type I restriction enzyme S subunit
MTQQNKSEMPKGWVETPLDDIANWGSGGTPKRSESSYYGGDVPWVKTGDLGPRLLNSASEYITELGVKNSSAKFFIKGSVAIAMYGATIGKTSILDFDATTNQACGVGQPIDGVTDTEFLYYLLKNEKQNFINKGKGGAQPNISQQIIKAHNISFPPLREQKRIVEKLDELLVQVQSIQTRLNNLPYIIKRFRQSVLAAAVSGKLTEQWRGENQVGEWNWLTIGDVSTVATGSTPKRTEPSFWDSSDIPWLTSSVTGNEFCNTATQFVSNKAVKECRLKLFPSGSLLLAMYGEGKTRGQVTEIKIDATCNQACAAILVDEDKISKAFVKLRLLENYEATRMAAEGGNQPNLNLTKVRNITIPVPPIEEQTEIVRLVEQHFALADTLEKNLKNAKQRVDNLTQSILAKAFRGELVPQDPNDEPAEQLLARIKKARLEAETLEKTAKKVAKASKVKNK